MADDAPGLAPAYSAGLALGDGIAVVGSADDGYGVRVHVVVTGPQPTSRLVYEHDEARVDELFGDLVSHNEEGQVLRGLPFTAENVERFVHHEPTQAAGAALLSLAWQHRSSLLSA